MAGLIAIKNELKPLQDRFKKKIAQLQIPDERILNYWSEDYISEFGQENFEEFKKWVEEKGISREKLIEFFVTSGYPIENAEVEAEKLILNLSRTLAKKVDKSDIRELFKVIIDVIAENKEDLSVDIEDILIGIDKVLDSQDRLLNLYGERFILLPPSLFKSRDDVKDILKFKFVGREEELKRLHDFMRDDSKIMAVFGEGGSGKTRLLVEFADQVEKRVYFVHPQKSFEHVRTEDAVLVLDDASKYKDFDKVVDFAVNSESWDSRNVKLIILNRNFFRKETVDRLKAKNIYCDVFDLGGADIAEFVKVNYGIEKVDEIISESGDNFFFASVIAEYFKKSGEIDLLKALEHRIEKYIEDLRKEPGKLSEEELAIYILSLIMPVDMKKDSEALKRIVDYDRFCVALESDLVKRVDDDYVIRPDPVGDYIRLKFMEEYRHLFDRYMNDFLVYMPFRIAYNVVTMLKLREDIVRVSLDLLEGIWEDLNTRDFESLEYFDALVFFTGNLKEIVAKNIERADTAKWVMMAEKINNPKIREKLAETLVNATYYYGEVKNFDKVETLLGELRELHGEHNEREIREEFAKALTNATLFHGEVKDFDKVETLLGELRDLLEEYGEREIREEFAKALTNATLFHGEVKNFDKVETLLGELRELHGEYNERETREEFAEALVNATLFHGEVKNFDKVETLLGELRELHGEHNEREIREKLARTLYIVAYCHGEVKNFDKVEIFLTELRRLHEEYNERETREKLAMALVNASNHYGEVKNFDKVETLLGELRELHGEYNEREIREEFASILVNATNDYGEVKNFDKVETLLGELRELHGEYNEREIREEFAKALVNASKYYDEVKDFDNVEIFLTELRRLHEEYKEREIREKLAMALVNASNHYGEVKDFDKVEIFLTELRRLHEEYKERETREELAKALYNAAICFSYTKYEYLHIVLEAYTNRYYLPEEPQGTHRRYLETLAIDLFSNRIIELHAKGEEYLTQFIKTIQTYLTDEIEFTLLMNEVTEKLPENIQKAVWKIIDRLNE